MLMFMDMDTYDQIEILSGLPGGARGLPPRGHEGDGESHEGKPIGVAIPSRSRSPWSRPIRW